MRKRYIPKYKQFNESNTIQFGRNTVNISELETNDGVRKVCGLLHIPNFTINDDLSVDVDGNVQINNRDLKKIPIKFGKITGAFDCSDNKLETLENSPYECNSFYCTNNKLTNLNYSPKIIYNRFLCDGNNLYTLKGCTKIIPSIFNCSKNLLSSLDDCPSIGGKLYCTNNGIKSLNNYSGDFDNIDFRGNPIYKLVSLFISNGIGKFGDNTETLERMIEFEIIKDNKIDTISVDSLFDFYEVNLLEYPIYKSKFYYDLSNIGYEII